MVLYREDGRVEIAHEEYLEREAQREAKKYTDQIDVYKQRNGQSSNNKVRIVIDKQYFRTAYCEGADGWGSDFEWIQDFRQREPRTIATPLCRETMILCSSTARDHFTYHPDSDELHLPVLYPQVDEVFQSDDQMAYIRVEEIEEYIIPWLNRVKAHMSRQRSGDGIGNGGPKRFDKTQNQEWRESLTRRGGPLAIDIPNSLLVKIHLYNAMLQMGLPKFVQLPLIDALVLQMYQTDLNACHLDTLEITIGRFYSRGLAILDPVLNHFIGTYALRSQDDRRNPRPLGSQSGRQRRQPVNLEKRRPQDLVRADGSLETEFFEQKQWSVDFSRTGRKYLQFATRRVRRGKFGEDTYLIPPKLPVLGHSIKHWSGVRSDGEVARAYTGLPLNVGIHKKFIRRDVSIAVDVDDCEEAQSNRLVGQEYCRNHGPGQVEE